nr:winged helix DNA-binding protein [uncultured Methanoregula sp.]
MDRRAHVHIISAGEKIAIAYPAMFRELPTISRTMVFTDSSVHDGSSDPVTDSHRLAVRNAVSAVQEISASLSIPFSQEMIFPPAYGSVRSALAKCRREYPDARFTFDLSGGSKELCLALFAFAPWLGGEVYASFDEKTARRVPLPDRSMSSLLSSPNHQTILAILLNRRDKKKEMAKSAVPTVPMSWVPRQYLYRQLFSYYVPSRTRKEKPGEPSRPVVQDKMGRKPAAELSHATFSGFVRTLRNAGLLEEEYAPESRKEKMYRITDAGETAFRFFSNPATSSLVRSVLESS